MRLRHDAGLTLLELVVAIAILAIGSLATLRAVDQSRIAIGGEAPRLIARLAARNRAEELQLPDGSGTLPSSEMMGNQRVTYDVTTTPTAGGLVQATVVARMDSGEGAQLILYLDPRSAR